MDMSSVKHLEDALEAPIDEAAVLGGVCLGYAPLIDPAKSITAQRLTVLPLPGAPLPAAADLAGLLQRTWPQEAGRLLLNLASEGLLTAMLDFEVPPQHQLEVPAFMACDAAHAARIKAASDAGRSLLLTGRPRAPLAAGLGTCFSGCVVDVADIGDARAGKGLPAQFIAAGVTTAQQMNDLFERGAQAVVGWPIGDLGADPAKKGARPEVQAVLELIQRLDRGESIDKLEAVLKRDPTLAYKLLRYLNSPAFGLSVEVTSFRHAIMLLGMQRLKRWLALLLASGVRDGLMRPVIHAAVRRGLLMEALGRQAGADDETAGDQFICGIFSMLDRLLQQSFDELLATIPTSEAVRAALGRREGPHAALLAVACAVEAGSVWETHDAAEAAMVSMPALNKAMLHALAIARQLD